MGKYSEDIALSKAWEILEKNLNSFLIDVRTIEEYVFVGAPWLEQINKKLIHIPWRLFPNMELNPDFVMKVRNAVPDTDSELLFICRSGGRSREAAEYILSLGYKNCYNIVEGFEGNLDSNCHRGKLNSWKAAGLPWRQS